MDANENDKIRQAGGVPTPIEALNQTDYSVYWKQCVSCRTVKPFSQFPRDASYREGVRDQCADCATSPRLSTKEHTLMRFEQNYYSEGTRKQRWEKQSDWAEEAPRWGRPLHAHEFIYLLRKIVGPNGSKVFLMDGRIEGDIAVFKIDCTGPQYMFYIPTSYVMPEFSILEFDKYDIPVKEKYRGWRTPLLRLIKSGVVTEDQCNKVFGKPEGVASAPWRRELWKYRNRT